jgi:hypothetical protein
VARRLVGERARGGYLCGRPEACHRPLFRRSSPQLTFRPDGAVVWTVWVPPAEQLPVLSLFLLLSLSCGKRRRVRCQPPCRCHLPSLCALPVRRHPSVAGLSRKGMNRFKSGTQQTAAAP